MLGVDVGTVRIGIAVSDPDGSIAVPVTTVRRGRRDLEQIAVLATERGVAGLVVGLPLTLSGQEGPAARASRDFATDLARQVAPTPVRLVDERLTTAGASRGLRDAGVGARQARHVVDQVAAAAILQGALDMQRATGRPVGELVPVPPASQQRAGDHDEETRTS
jgi:putative Holliday junction resolvase